jgi:hypothetical protein
MWRGAHGEQGFTDLSRFFSRRNLWALARLWQEFGAVTDPILSSRLQFAFTAAMVSSTNMVKYVVDRGGRSNLPGTLYVPSLNLERNVAGVIERRFSRVVRAVQDFNRLLKGKDSRCHVSVGSASRLGSIPNRCLDYIFTDPPFGSNIFYADCNLIWEAWLDQGYTD